MCSGIGIAINFSSFLACFSDVPGTHVHVSSAVCLRYAIVQIERSQSHQPAEEGKPVHPLSTLHSCRLCHPFTVQM